MKPKSCINCPAFEMIKKVPTCKVLPSYLRDNKKTIEELYKNCPIDW